MRLKKMLKKKHLLVLAACASSDPKQSFIFSLKVHRVNANKKKMKMKIKYFFASTSLVAHFQQHPDILRFLILSFFLFYFERRDTKNVPQTDDN